MESSSKILAWVNSYGQWNPQGRHPIEIIGHDAYLDGVTRALFSLNSRLGTVYIAGGRRDNTGTTECESVGRELKRRLSEKGMTDTSFQYDSESTNAIAITRAFLQTWHSSYSDHLPLLFIDTVRTETTTYLLEYFAQKNGLQINPHEILVPLNRLDHHQNSTLKKQQEKLARWRELGVEAGELEETAQ